METSVWVALVGAVAMVAAGTVSAVASLRTAYLTAKSQKDQQRMQDDTNRHKNELDELREFRKELRDDVHRLEERVNGLTVDLHEAQGQIIRQREYFIGILYKLEGIIAMKDNSLIIHELALLVRHVREFLDLPIGAPEIAMRQIRGEQE